MKLLSLGDTIKDGTYTHHSTFSDVINYEKEGMIISLVNQKISEGPTNMVFDTIEKLEYKTINIDKNNLTIGDRFFSTANKYNSQLKSSKVKWFEFQQLVKKTEDQIVLNASDKSLVFLIDKDKANGFNTSFEKKILARFFEVFHKFFPTFDIEELEKIKGLGMGLTPAGDDFIKGIVMGLHVKEHITGDSTQEIRKQIFDISKSESVFTNTSLLMALQGNYYLHFKNLIEYYLGYNKNNESELIKKAMNHGETSGADTMTGFYLTVKHL